MIARVVGIELRRSAAPVVAVVTVLLAGWLLYLGHGPWDKAGTAWTRQWDSLAIWQRQMLMFLCPLALGFGATQGRRDHRSTMDELVTTMPRPAWQRVLPVTIAMGIGLGGGYLLLAAGGAVQVAGHTPYQHLDWLPITAVGVLALVAAGWLGMGVGRALPSVLTAPLLAAAGLAGVILALGVPGSGAFFEGLTSQRTALLSPSLANVQDVFTTVAPRVDVGQAVWFAGLAATGFALLATRRLPTRLAALAPALLGLVVALTTLPGTPDSAYVPDPGAGALVCTTDGPRVCVTRAHQDALAALTGPGRQALTLLAVLPGAPTAVVEDNTSWTQPDTPRPDVLLANFNNWDLINRDGSLRPADQLLPELLAGAGTPACVERHVPELADRVDLARTLAADWLLGSFRPPVARFSGDTPPVAEAQRVWQILESLPRQQQVARIAALRTAALQCRGDLLTILTGGAR